MAVQASTQHLQASVPADAYALDTPTSRRHYPQQSPVTDSYRSVPSPQSARRPSRHPSNDTQSGDPVTPQQLQYRSPTNSQPSSTSTARPLPTPTTFASTAAPGNVVTPSYQHHRRDQRNEQDLLTGAHAPIPPPRTSSNQRGPINPSVPSAVLTDRTVDSSQSNLLEDQSRTPRITSSFEAQQREEAHLAVLAEYQRATEQSRLRDDSATNNATAARARRRGPASPEGPQRSASTRERRTQPSPTNVQSRSAVNVQSPTPPAKLSREESEILNRVVVTDPVIDLDREKQRLAEATPARSASESLPPSSGGRDGKEEIDDSARGSGRSRQDHSSSAARRKDNTKFGDYMLGQTLGEGEFGKVKLGWKKDGSVQVAIKLIKRENINTNPSRLPKIYREITILRGLSHPNIVRLHEMIETDRHIGIILEYASGGELFDYILNHRYLKDAAARRLFAQLVSGVGYLHKNGIVHRDLKLENLLLDRNRNIIITDFGFANTFNPQDELSEEIEYNLSNREFVKRMDLDRVRNGTRRGDLMQTSCGSPCYAAPELVVTDSLYTGRKVDVWSCGVILYAMLAGYLPFDDDPDNPEGDNINLLYKYIVSTPLTFPEYVTPHARDLLRRILVPEPRTRADLFEIARHSWLSEYAHVVSHVTSSTTTVGEIVNNATVSHDQQDAPLITRSASVREPSKPHSANMSPVGGLSRQGQLDPEQAEKTKPPRDSKRRTVQVEYVAPQSQTVRGELSPSPASDPRKVSPAVAQGSTRNRSGSQGLSEAPRHNNTSNAVRKPLPQEPPVSQEKKDSWAWANANQAPLTSNKTQQRPSGSQPAMQPPARPTREVPRSVSDSAGAFGDLPASSSARPTTGGSMASMSGGRLPSRGNSYSLPLAPTVAATNAQGKLMQPKYNISAPIPQPEPYISESSIRRPSTQQVPSRLSQAPTPREEVRAHKRSSTLSNLFGKSGSIFGGKSSQPQSPQDATRPQTEKRYPPVSMKAPISSDSPRQSTDSRRPSFNFGRKNSDSSRQEKQDKPRRFSLLPSGFAFKNSNNGSRDQAPDSSRPPSERKRSITQYQQTPRGNPQGYPYGRNASPYQSTENLQAYDGQRDRNRQASAPQSTSQIRRDDFPTTRNAPQSLQSLPVESSQYASPQPSSIRPGQSYFNAESGPPTDSEVSIAKPQQRRPQYPAGFNSYEEEPPRPVTQQARNGRGPGVLQNPTRNFTDAYDQDHDRGHHAGSSGAAKRVMDFFRRRGKARTGEDR